MTFSRNNFRAATHSWTHCEVQPLPDAVAETLAREIATDIVRQRTLGAPSLYASWTAALSGTPLGAEAHRLLPIYLEPGLGTRAFPSTDTLTQAAVAEHLWHVAMYDARAQRSLVLVTKPKLYTTAPGGDGLDIADAFENYDELGTRDLISSDADGDGGPCRRPGCALGRLRPEI